MSDLFKSPKGGGAGQEPPAKIEEPPPSPGGRVTGFPGKPKKYDIHRGIFLVRRGCVDPARHTPQPPLSRGGVNYLRKNLGNLYFIFNIYSV